MGTYVEEYVQITLSSKEDADKVCEMLHNIKERVLKRIEETSCYFNVYEMHQTDEYVEVIVNSDRAQNCDWQINQIVEELKVMVKDKEITTVEEFYSSIMKAGEGLHLDQDYFEDEE